MSSRRASHSVRIEATLWSGCYCTACPAARLCTSRGASDACSEPALYDRTAAHPARLMATPGEFEFPDFNPGDSEPVVGEVPRSRVLALSDGVHTSTVRLKGAMARLRAGRIPGPDAMAVLHGRDLRLRDLINHRGQLGRSLMEAGFSSVISPCYSTWESYPPFDALVAQALTARFATELTEHLPTIPSVGWRRHDELPRWADWLLRNNQRSFAMHPATMRTQYEWDWWIAGLWRIRTLLASDSERPPHIFVNGPCTAPRVSEVIRVWRGPVTFLTQQPWQLALYGKVLSEELEEVPEDRALTVLERLQLSVTNFDRFVQSQETALVGPALTRAAASAG